MISDYLWFDVETTHEALSVLDHSLSGPYLKHGLIRMSWNASARCLSCELHGADGLTSHTREFLSSVESVPTGSELSAAENAYRIVHLCLMNEAHSRGWSRLHAALVEVCDERIMIVGPSGAGKTGLSVRLAQVGARVLSDEGVLIKAGQALPLPRRVHIKDPDRGNLASSLFFRAVGLDYQPPLWTIDPAQLGGDLMRSAGLDAVVMLGDRLAATTALTPASVEDALQMLLIESADYESHVEERSVSRIRMVADVARLVEQVELWRLDGYSGDRGVRAIERLVA